MENNDLKELIAQNKELKASLRIMYLMFSVGIIAWVYDRFNPDKWIKTGLIIVGIIILLFILKYVIDLIKMRKER